MYAIYVLCSVGGFVFLDRVNGELAMSRALGDYQYKRNDDLSIADQMVSCYPDVSVHKRNDGNTIDRLLILACDGVWDVMSNNEAIGYLENVILKDEKDASSETMADSLVRIALTAGSTDNISAVVVKLNGGK